MANILSAYSSFGVRDEPLFAHLASVVRALQKSAHGGAAENGKRGRAAGGDEAIRYAQSMQTFGAQALSMIVQVPRTSGALSGTEIGARSVELMFIRM